MGDSQTETSSNQRSTKSDDSSAVNQLQSPLLIHKGSTSRCVCTSLVLASGVLQPWICCFPRDPQMCERISRYSSLLLMRGERAAAGADLEGGWERGGANQLHSDFQDYFIWLHTRPQAGTYSAGVWETAGTCGEPKEDRLNDAVLDGENEGAGGGRRGSLLRPKKRLNL